MTHISLKEITTFQSVLAEPLRIRIVRLLLERELCVCEIERVLGEPQYKISRHLGILKRVGLVNDWREGTWMHYEIAPALAPLWRNMLESLRQVWDASPEITKDIACLYQQHIREPGAPVFCSG